MKRLLILTAVAVLTAGTSGCECCRRCMRPQTCDPCGSTPYLGTPSGPYMSGEPVQTVSPAPQTYTPVPVNP